LTGLFILQEGDLGLQGYRFAFSLLPYFIPCLQYFFVPFPHNSFGEGGRDKEIVGIFPFWFFTTADAHSWAKQKTSLFSDILFDIEIH
jgi:hypothetical protein